MVAAGGNSFVPHYNPTTTMEDECKEGPWFVGSGFDNHYFIAVHSTLTPSSHASAFFVLFAWNWTG